MGRWKEGEWGKGSAWGKEKVDMEEEREGEVRRTKIIKEETGQK